MSNCVLKTLGTAAVGAALLAVSASAQSITKPANWPGDEMVFGYTWGAQGDNLSAITAPTQELTKGLFTYPYRYVSMQLNSAGQADASVAISAMNELSGTIASLKGWDGSESQRHVGMGAVMSIFSGELGDAQVEARDERYLILRKMNDVATLARWFSWLDQVKGALNSASQAPIVILEPNVWGTILQARFHFESDACNESWCSGMTWADVLNFHVPLNEGLAQAGSPIAGEVAGNPGLYPQTVAGLARAMVRAARQAMPRANIFSHVSTWAAYANGCSQTGTSGELTNDRLREYKSTLSMVTWQDDDIKISAMANVRFYRDLFGWNEANGGHLDESVWPDGFAVEKYTYDAGLVQDPNGTGHYRAQSIYPMPGAGSAAFFWDQTKMNHWITWMTTLSQGSRMPLLAYGIPLGNGALSNQPFSWQDTFVDWLFSSSNWGSTYTWDGDNWNKFKQAGFVGILASRAGWPATGTHWGSRTQAGGDGTGCNISINNVMVGCPGSTSGDNNFFVTQFKGHDRSLSPIPVTFDEETFAQFSGFCRGRSEATVNVEEKGIRVDSTKSKGVFAGGSKGDVNTPVVKITGATTTNATPDNVAAIANMPEYMKTNAMWLMAKLPDESYELIQNNPSATEMGLVKGQTRGVNNGLVNGSNAGEVANVLSTTAGIGLELEVDLGNIESFDSWDPANKQAGVFPVEYELYIFDNLGNFINSATGYLSETDVVKYVTRNASTGSLVLTLMVYFVPIDQKGRHIASGVYMMRGFFKEEAKTMCQKLKTSPDGCVADASVPPLGDNTNTYNCPIDPAEPVVGACREKLVNEYGIPANRFNSDGTPNFNPGEFQWKRALIQNSVVITKSFGYMRTKAN